jgi:uncharacterized protein
MAIALDLPRQQIAEFCRRHAIRRLALFGSVLRTDFRDESDVDVLVDFTPEAKVNFFQFVEVQDSLQRILNREIDLHTEQSLGPTIRSDILASAEVIYEQER